MVVETSMPAQVGLYRVLKHLETDELAEVYLGEDTSPSFKGDRVAIKRLRPELQARDPLYARGFVAEGEVGRRISHPNVVQTYDVIVQEGVPYLIMEFVDGISLTDLASAADGRVEPAVLAEVARQLCEGLAALHDATDEDGNPLGIVHQSVRPTNVAINKRGDVKLLDLGVTRSKIQGRGGVKLAFDDPTYLAPEQVRADPELTPASDQYAVGVLVFELLCGIPFLSALEALARLAEKRFAREAEAPSGGDRSLERLDDVLEKEAREGTVPFQSPPPKDREGRLDWARRELPGHLQDLEELPGGGLDEVLARMLAYDPEERYPTIREAGADLLRWAWGTGHTIDFRKYVAELISRFRGEEPEEPEEKPLDEEAIKAAAESSLVPKSIVLGVGTGDSAFVPPPQKLEAEPSARPAAPVNLADPAFSAPADHTPPPGALLDDPTGKLPVPPTPPPEPQHSSTPPFWVRHQVAILSGTVVALLFVVVGLYLLRDSLGFGPADTPPRAQPLAVTSRQAAPAASGQGTDSLRQMLASAEKNNPEAPSPPSPPSLDGFRGLRETEPGASSNAQPADTGDVPRLPPEKLVPFKGRRTYGSGSLTIETSPPGAQVILNGVNVQTSPVTFENIPAGQHQLILRSEELGQRDVVLIELRNGQDWRGTWSFFQKSWISRE